MNRRQFLGFTAATAGVITLAAAGSAAMIFEDSYTYIPALLRELIGDYSMAAEQEQAFIDALARDYGEQKLMAVIGLHRIRNTTGLGIAYTNDKLDQFERRLVTDFLISTDYLRQPKTARPQLSFIGYRIPCNNPFARFT